VVIKHGSFGAKNDRRGSTEAAAETNEFCVHRRLRPTAMIFLVTPG
jgi:hypothetical protein